MLKSDRSSLTKPYVGVAIIGMLAGCTDPASNPNATVALKRGAFVRVINLTGQPIEAQAGDRSIAIATPPAQVAPFVLVPPKMNKLTVKGESDSVEVDLKLEPEKNFSFVCFRTNDGLRVLPIGDTPTKAGKDGPVIVIFNALDGNASVDSSKEKASLPALSASQTMNLPLSEVKFTGTTSIGKIASNTVKPVFDGAYLGVIYKSQGKPAMQVFHTNAPMDVAGSSR